MHLHYAGCITNFTVAKVCAPLADAPPHIIDARHRRGPLHWFSLVFENARTLWQNAAVRECCRELRGDLRTERRAHFDLLDDDVGEIFIPHIARGGRVQRTEDGEIEIKSNLDRQF